MGENAQVSFPRSGNVCVVSVDRDNINISNELAEGMYRIYTQYNQDSGFPSDPYVKNESLQLLNGKENNALGDGLVFRLFDGGLKPVVEFYVPPEFSRKHDQLFMEIPKLLEQAGLTDPLAIDQITQALVGHTQKRAAGR